MWLTAADLAFLAGAGWLYWIAHRRLLGKQGGGRGLELRVCTLTAVLISAGFALAHAGMSYSWTGRAQLGDLHWLVFPLGLALSLGIAHLLLRLQGSRADQMLMPVAAFLAALGLIGLYVWETRDADAYISTVALPSLERHRAAFREDPSLLPERREAILKSLGAVPNQLTYERRPKNSSRGLSATVLNGDWLDAYNSAVRRVRKAAPEAGRAPPVHEVHLYSALRKQWLVACLCILLIPALVFALGRLRQSTAPIRRRALLGASVTLLALAAAVVAQSKALRLPALIELGGRKLTVYDALKLGLVLVLALCLVEVGTVKARRGRGLVVMPLTAVAAAIIAVAAIDHGAGVALVLMSAFLVTSQMGRRGRRLLVAVGVIAILAAPAAGHLLRSVVPNTVQARLEMWSDPWGAYQRRAVRREVSRTLDGIVAARLAERRSRADASAAASATARSPSQAVSHHEAAAIAPAVQRDMRHLVQELRWRVAALDGRSGQAEPFVPSSHTADKRVLREAEGLWSDLGGYDAATRTREGLEQLEAATGRAILELQARARSLVAPGRATAGVGALRNRTAGPHEGDNFQLQRGFFALHRGGLFGTGLGRGRPEAIPAVLEDVPLVVVGESLGFIGVALVALLILLIAVRAVAWAAAESRPLARLLMVGLAGLYAVQTLIDMGGMAGVLPFTGLTFPFVGRGGTGLTSSFIALSLIMAIAASSEDEPQCRPEAPSALGRSGAWRAVFARGAGLPAAFGVVLVSIASLQLFGRTLMPGSLLQTLPSASPPVAHAQNQWATASYRTTPGSVSDRRGRMLVTSRSRRLDRAYAGGEVSKSLGHTLMQLDESFHDELLRASERSPPVGPTLVTTVDAQMQMALHRSFGRGAMAAGLTDGEHLRGAAVILDTKTGEILALESWPAFSPNELSNRAAWAEAEAADRRAGFPYRYLNRVVHGYYPPGSIFKTITAAGALEGRLHTLHGRDFDYRRGSKGPRRPDGLLHLGRWHRLKLRAGPPITDGNHPHVLDWDFSLDDAYKWSCNIAFAQLGIELGPARLVRAARGFGFERRVDVPGLGASLSTLDNDRDKPPRSRYLAKNDGTLARTAFGQGQVRATPLQMAMTAATIASGGRIMQPHIVLGWKRPGGAWIRKARPRTLASSSFRGSTLRDLRRMMRDSVSGGIAAGARLNPENGRPGVAGKTGSAEWTEAQDAAHAWFMGFFPTEAPRLAVALVVERGGLGPTVAVRVARRIFGAAAVRRYVSGGSRR